jgi:hypothetical protein
LSYVRQEKGSQSPATITTALDTEHGFETAADEINLRTIFGLLDGVGGGLDDRLSQK